MNLFETVKNSVTTRQAADIDISEYIWKKESQKLKDTGCLAFEKKKWIIVEDGDSSDYE